MNARPISKYADVIDSPDVIERIEELQADEARTDDETAELQALEALQDEAQPYCEDWQYGAALIRYSHFVTYAQELADDIGAIPKDAGWPCTCIDWEQAARELQMDYTSVEFDGITYWVR